MLKYIFENERVYQAKISKVLNLSPPTVSRNLLPYFAKKILRKNGKIETKMGRKAEIIEFSDEYKALGIQIDKNFLKLCVVGLNRKTFKYWEKNVDTSNFEKLKITLKEELKKIRDMKIVSTVIGFSGYIIQNKFMFSSITNWGNAPCEDIIQLIGSNFPNSIIYFENDANLLAIREKYFQKEKDNLICIYWGYGIGMGIIIKGDLYIGQGMAGELGQIKIDNVILEELLRGKNKNEMTTKWLEIIENLIYLFHPKKIVLNIPFNGILNDIINSYNSQLKEKLQVVVEKTDNSEKAIIEGAIILASDLFLSKIATYY